MTMTELAHRINTSVNNLSNKLRNKTIPFDKVEEIADLLGYDIEFKKRHKQQSGREFHSRPALLKLSANI